MTPSSNESLYNAASAARVKLIEQVADLDDSIMEIYLEGKGKKAIKKLKIKKKLKKKF